ncbi:MAG: hypothetical protein N2Z79_01210, partial [Candidatus Omnitrophica bacterium]|nr:hypothetical protein [Candidatus Omnitrophota bacterium]
RFNRIFGASLVISGLALLLNAYPFLDLKFTPYQCNLGILPYQYFIDYINAKGAITIWAHPEAENIQEIGEVTIETKEYPQVLTETKNYTGFTIFYEGYKKIGRAGGIWDNLLGEYCKGKRKTPIWAIGGLGFDNLGDLNDYLRDLRNMLLLREFNKKEILEAIRKGRFYILKGRLSSDFILDRFIIKDKFHPKEANMGEEIELSTPPLIEIKGQFINMKDYVFNLKLIREGRIVKTWQLKGNFHLTFEDTDKDLEASTFYRIEIDTDNLHLISNPIFVKYKKDELF